LSTQFDQRGQKVNTQLNAKTININLALKTSENLLQQESLVQTIITEFGEKLGLEQRFIHLKLRKIDQSKPVLPFDEFAEESIIEEEFFPEILLNNNKNVLILGGPGSGKTTLLKWVSLQVSKNKMQKKDLNKFVVPLYIPLKRYPEILGDDPFHKLLGLFIEQLILYHGITSFINSKQMQDLLQEIPFLFLLDGINDVISNDETEKDIEKVTTAIQLVSELFPKSRYILTSRKYLEEKKIIKSLKPQLILDVRELSFEQAQDFIKKYELENEANSLLFSDLPPRIRKLGQTPLYLRFIAELHQTGLPFSDTPIGIISNIMHQRLEWENISTDNTLPTLHKTPKKHFPSDLLEKQALIALAKLAQKFQGVIKYDDPDNKSETALLTITNLTGKQEIAKILIARWCQKDLLYFVGEHIEFWHPVFQTYLIAEEMAEEFTTYFSNSPLELRHQLKQIISNTTLHDILSMSIALVNTNVARIILDVVINEDIVLAGMCLNNAPNLQDERLSFIKKLSNTYKILRVDWFGFPIVIGITLTVFVLLLPFDIPFLPNLFYTINNSMSLFVFIAWVAASGIFFEFMRVVYSHWVNKNYMSPISKALGHMHYPDSTALLDEIVSTSYLGIIDGVNEAGLRAKLENVDTLDDLQFALMYPTTMPIAVRELAKRCNENTICILVELLERTMLTEGTSTIIQTSKYVVENLLLLPKHAWIRELIAPSLLRFYKNHSNLINWSTRVNLYKYLTSVKSEVISYPLPRFLELVSTNTDSGYSMVELYKWIAMFFLMYLALGLALQVTNWLF
jgi:hypothetical protein